jgi:uncharacterized protein (TIGR03905 family)
MKYCYKTNGQVCAQLIELELDEANHIVQSVNFVGGCPGNHLGIASLVKDMRIDEVIRRLSGITCGGRNSSCPDQLAKALQQFLNEQN